MELATFTDGWHDPRCSGCPCCDGPSAQLLDDPTNVRLRASVARASVFRTTQQKFDERTDPPPPDLNAAIRTARPTTTTSDLRTARLAEFFKPVAPPPDQKTSEIRAAEGRKARARLVPCTTDLSAAIRAARAADGAR
jgi:hypothetical protein